jgi:steroid 5-alpha reductase family enzyme
MPTNPYLLTLLISFAINLGFFIFAAVFKTDKLTDLSYGLSFILLTIFLLVTQQTTQTPQLIIAGLVIIWGIRLITYLFIRILKIKKDSRFDEIRNKPLEFAKFWFFQALAVWVIMLPSTTFLTSQAQPTITFLTLIGVTIALIGLNIEAIADWQKFTFKNQPQNKNKWIQSGIWQYSRHPNYFGEMTFWWGLFITVTPVLSNWQWLTIAGPIFITSILLFASGIPPLEKRYNKKYANNKEYQIYKKQTSLLIPLPKN